MTAAAAATAAALYRVRTITAFLQLPRDESKWEPLLADAGEFLTAAQRSLEALGECGGVNQLMASVWCACACYCPQWQPSQPLLDATAGYEVQTTRLATQPFPEFLRLAGDDDAALIAQRAAALEAAAARHGIRLLSLGAASDPRDLAVLPALIAATAATSVSYALPPDAGRELLSAVAATVLEIAAATGVVWIACLLFVIFASCVAVLHARYDYAAHCPYGHCAGAPVHPPPPPLSPHLSLPSQSKAFTLSVSVLCKSAPIHPPAVLCAAPP